MQNFEYIKTKCLCILSNFSLLQSKEKHNMQYFEGINNKKNACQSGRPNIFLVWKKWFVFEIVYEKNFFEQCLIINKLNTDF